MIRIGRFFIGLWRVFTYKKSQPVEVSFNELYVFAFYWCVIICPPNARSKLLGVNLPLETMV